MIPMRLCFHQIKHTPLPSTSCSCVLYWWNLNSKIAFKQPWDKLWTVSASTWVLKRNHLHNTTHWIAGPTVAPFSDAEGQFYIIKRSSSALIYTCPLVQFLDVAACFCSSWLNATVSSCAREHAARARPPGICCLCSRNIPQFKFVFCITDYFFTFIFLDFLRTCTLADSRHWASFKMLLSLKHPSCDLAFSVTVAPRPPLTLAPSSHHLSPSRSAAT